MRSAIDILQQAFRANSGNFVADRTRRNPEEELQKWVAQQKAGTGGKKPSLDCLKSASKDFSDADIPTLLFRYERCLGYLLEKNMMAHAKTTSLLEHCANQPPTNLRFWRGLFSAYFSFDRDSYPNGNQNWRKLQQLLSAKLDFLVKQSQGKREWITYLSAHRDLLTEKPGVQFAEESFRTGKDTTSELKVMLDIPPESWFWKQYLFTKITVSEKFPNFHSRISAFIAELRKTQFMGVRSEGIKQLLEIYQRKGFSAQTHQELLDFAIEYWKAPYKNNHADWKRINDVTYQMVQSWFTCERLHEFIGELRGSNHVKDERLDFWANYCEAIGGRFFILLGRDFILQRRFKEIALKYPQNFGALSGKSTNNVLIFDFGNLYAVVSSELGNALYFYDKQRFPIQLKKCDPMIYGDKKSITSPDIYLDVLRDQSKAYVRIVQRDGWQLNAEKVLLEHGIAKSPISVRVSRTDQNVGSDALQATSQVFESSSENTQLKKSTITNDSSNNAITLIERLLQLAKKYQLNVSDRRDKGGVFWITYFDEDDDKFQTLKEIFEDLGCSYVRQKGFWLKNELAGKMIYE